MTPTQTLVVHQGALGDWVLTFGLLRALGGSVAVASHPDHGRLAGYAIAGIESESVDAPVWSRLLADGAGVCPVSLARASRVVSFVSDGHDAWAHNVRRLAPDAVCYFVSPRPPKEWPHHVTRWHTEQLGQQGWAISPRLPLRRVNPVGPLVIHPGSGGPRKCWPIERFLEVARSWQALGQSVRFTLGHVEMETMPPEVIRTIRDEFPTDIPMDLPTLAELIARAQIYLGNDAGPTHLAAQLGIPTIALFGPTDPRTWRPIGPSVTVLHPLELSPMSWLDASSVLDVLRASQRSGE